VASFNVLFRRQVDLLREQQGLEYVKLARRLLPEGGEDVLLFEEWRSTADVYRWAGSNLAEPRLVPGVRELITSLAVTHYEALDREPDVGSHDEPMDGESAGAALASERPD
jgi:hypothetical protein